MATVHSYDVFDTVLTRRVGDPEAVITVLAQRLAQAGRLPVTAAVFAAARRRHERRLNRLSEAHAPLREVYAETAAALSVDAAQGQDWCEAEVALERELTVPVPGALEMIEKSRAEGVRVAFVSDTPHSEATLRELLGAHGLATDDDLVITSSQRGVTKSKGGLFTAVAEMLGDTETFWHRGDNQRSDFESARAEGWDSAVLPRARLTRYERLLEREATATDGLTSWLAGSSRLARLEAYERGVAAPVADVAAGSMAPMLVGYALWTLGQARLRGLKRLYFVARDGEVMLEVARQVIGRLAPDIELRYLHGSRQPWVYGACATSEPILAHWAQGRTDFTARTTVSRLGLTPEQVFAETGFAPASPERADTPLSADDRVRLAELLQSEPLVSTVRAGAAESAERTIAYLRQEGLTDGTPSALVDAGWSGRAAAALDHLLVTAGAAPVPHLFVGLLGSAAEEDLRRDVTLVPWLFDRQRHPGSTAGLHAPNVLVEMFCAGTSGRTVDYEIDPADGTARPVLDRELNDPSLDWGLREIQAIAVRVAELLAPHLDAQAGHLDSTAYVWEVLRAFWTHPTKAEVAAWGSFPGEEEIWPPFMPLAQQITAPAMLKRALRGEKTMRPNNTWRAGSAVASNHPWRGLLRLRAWREENDARIRRIPRRIRMAWATRRRR